MKIRKKLCSTVVASTTVFLLLILISSMASASTIQDSPSNGPYAYITSGSNSVYVIDTANNTVTATVHVGNYTYPEGVTVTPDGKKVYVTNSNSSSVSVINTANNTVTATVPIGSHPKGVTVTPDGKKAYIANSLSNSVSVIDTANSTVTATVSVGSYPNGIAVIPDGTRVYVANYYSNTVSVIDTANNTVTAAVSIGSYPNGVAVTPDGKKVYVANSNYTGTVSVIDTATNTAISTVSVGSYPHGVAITPDGTKVYVTNSGSNSVSVINTANNTVTATVPIKSYPHGVAVTPDGKEVYVTNDNNGGTVSVIDTVTNEVTATVPVESYPIAWGQFIGPVGPVLPVANFSANVTTGNAPLSVQFTDLSTNITEWNWSFGDGASSVEKNPVHTYSTAGNYTVTLTANNSAGSNTVTKYSYITVVKSDDAIIQGYAPLSVKFTDLSEGATSWKWEFGDGDNSTEQNPTHTYNETGQYTVSLKADNMAGNSAVTKYSYVSVVNSVEAPVADFSASVNASY